MAGGVRDSLFGEIVARAGLCTEQQVSESLEIQERYRKKDRPVPRLGEILAAKKYLTIEQVKAVLDGDYTKQSGRFGGVATRLKLCSNEAVERALAAQSRLSKEDQPHKRIGELLVESGDLAAHHLNAVLGSMGLVPRTCPSCREVSNVQTGAAEQFCPVCGSNLKPPEGETEESQADTKPGEKPVPLPEAPEASPEDGGRIAEAARQEKAAEFGDYQILARLGVNASGGLYLARKGDGGKLVTFKVFSAELSRRKDFIRDFAAVAKDGAKLKHPAINRVVDAGRARGRAFCASEYVKGRSLRYLLEKQGKLPPALALNLARQIAEALAYAHSQGVVHGDLKPSNVIVDPDMAVKIANFGVVTNPLHNLLALSKLSGSAPVYAAPELAVKGARPTAKSDIYSLGAVLYHMLAGRPPFEGSSPLQTLMRVAEEELAPPGSLVEGVPGDAEEVVMAMLAIEPAERHADMAAAVEDLRDLGAAEPPEPKPAAEEEPAPEPEPSAEEAAERAAARRQALAGTAMVAGVGVFFLALALALVLTVPEMPPEPAVKPLPAPPPGSAVTKARGAPGAKKSGP